LTAKFEETGDIKYSDQATSLLESCIPATPGPEKDDPDRHYLLLNLALTLRRRVEIQVSGKPVESLLALHLALTRCLLLLRQAAAVSPSTFNVRTQYLGQLGHTATLWSTTLSSVWSSQEVLALLDHLKAELAVAKDLPPEERITEFVPAVVMASTLSTAWGLTRKTVYRDEGREVYRHTLK
jgi:hypothetical protein